MGKALGYPELTNLKEDWQTGNCGRKSSTIKENKKISTGGFHHGTTLASRSGTAPLAKRGTLATVS